MKIPKKIRTLDPLVVKGKARKYVTLRNQESEIKKEKDALSKELKEAAIASGAKDENGSFILELGELKVSNLAVNKEVIDQDLAVQVLKRIGGQALVDRCTARVLDQKAIEVCFQEGIISLEDIKEFSKTEVSYRIDVREV